MRMKNKVPHCSKPSPGHSHPTVMREQACEAAESISNL